MDFISGGEVQEFAGKVREEQPIDRDSERRTSGAIGGLLAETWVWASGREIQFKSFTL